MEQYRWNKLKKKAKYLGYEILTRRGTNKLLEEWANKKGFNSYEEYLDIMAIARGFTCFEEYSKVWEYYPGMPNPIKENRKDPRFIGVYVAENSILKLFEGSKKTKHGNPRFDIVCNKGYKVEVKAATLTRYNTFTFHLDQNKVADYFILIGFNNILELKPLYFWIIKNGDIIRGDNIANFDSLSVSNEPNYVKQFQKYNKIDKLKMLEKFCLEFNEYERIEECNDHIPNKGHILDIITKLRLIGKSNVSPENISDILREEHRNRLRIIPKEECR